MPVRWTLAWCVLVMLAAIVAPAHGQTDSGVTRYAVLELGSKGDELIGVQITDDAVRSALGLIQQRAAPNLVILRFKCGGGMLREVPQLVELITRIQQDARVVAWVDGATSAAALTAMSCPEIVMTSDGTIGAAVTYEMKGGEPVALRGEELDRALQVGAEISRRTGRDPRIIRAMQTPTALSYDIGPNGAVTLEDGTKGQVLLSAEGSILTLAPVQAKEIGVSLGTADTLEGVMGLLGVSRGQNVGLVAEGALEHQMGKASAALTRMSAGVTDLWDTLDRARAAENARERTFELENAEESLAALKQDAKDWPDVAEYLGLDEAGMGAYGKEIEEIRKGGE